MEPTGFSSLPRVQKCFALVLLIQTVVLSVALFEYYYKSGHSSVVEIQHTPEIVAKQVLEVTKTTISSHALEPAESNEVAEEPSVTTNPYGGFNARFFDRRMKILAVSPEDFIKLGHSNDGKTDAKYLFRNIFFGGHSNMTASNHDLFRDCPISHCELSTDISSFNESDVVIFWMSNKWNRLLGGHKVLRSDPHQMFVYHYFEQPHHYGSRDMPLMNELIGFNWTVHYQNDATVFFPLGKTISLPESRTSKNYASGKMRKVLWMVSNCHTPYQHREHYIAELIKYIDIDVYGKCTAKPDEPRSPSVSTMGKQYKFYIAFENADCDDYITEKFFMYLSQIDTIPIVLGRRNGYERWAPPMSYIEADQFDSPADLAKYLHLLDSEDNLYNQYFEWKKKYKVHWKEDVHCDMCKTFHDRWSLPEQTVDMVKFHSIKRCFLAERSIIKGWRESLVNETEPNPWLAIRQYNGKEKPLTNRTNVAIIKPH